MDYEYTKKSDIGVISKNKREVLDFLNREITEPFRISDVMKLLNISYGKAAHPYHGSKKQVQKHLELAVE